MSEFTSGKYRECWEAANKWLGNNAPDFVVESIQEISKYIEHLQEIIEDRDQFIEMMGVSQGSSEIMQILSRGLMSGQSLLQNGGGTAMSFETGAMKICDDKEAYKFGFSIEGKVCFIWDIANKSLLCLGYNELNETWQADILDDDGFAYQKTDTNLRTIMDACQRLADASHAMKNMPEFNLVKFLTFCGWA